MLVIIPFYNEENRIPIEKYNRLFSEYKEDKNIIIDDISIDNSFIFLQIFSNISFLPPSINYKKALANRTKIVLRNHIDFFNTNQIEQKNRNVRLSD